MSMDFSPQQTRIAKLVEWAAKEALFNGAGKIINPEIFEEAAIKIEAAVNGEGSGGRDK